MVILRSRSESDRDKFINSLKMLMAEVHSQTKDIPSEVIEQEIDEAIKEARSKKRHAKK